MNKEKEKEFKFRCERLAREITKETDIIFTMIQYKEIVIDAASNTRLNCSAIEFGRKNRIQVTLVGRGVGAQRFNSRRKKRINQILKTNVRYCKDSETMTHQITITFNVNPHKM